MKKIKRDLKEGYVTYFRSDEPVLIPEKIEEKDALRGVWVSTVANIDLPKMKDVASYKKHLDDIIKTVKEYKMNAVIFQVRPTNDAFYVSELNPWSAYITGEQGKYPGFDVFGYFVEKANKAGIEVHAWLNPYRVSQVTLDKLEMTKEEFLASLPDKSFAKQNPDLVMETSRKALILDPASKEVQEFVSDTALEIAKKYDV
ncbi:MAG TPA: family 10 glycosylhydrolase, partial [Bacilli bacterium]|nr:family 10 glycosylhydrolase [Bacilli bacterium]